MIDEERRALDPRVRRRLQRAVAVSYCAHEVDLGLGEAMVFIPEASEAR